jgi:hypothetical protein
MAKRLGRAEVEPPAVYVHHCLTWPRILRSAPPSRDAANFGRLVDDAGRRCHSLHDGVKETSRPGSLKLALAWFNSSAHGGHCYLVLCTDSVDRGPRGHIVIFPECLHLVSPV